jgi:hypothetical protein
MWGHGTTEYALEALRAASRGEVFRCPVDLDVPVPMIYVDDLMRGLVALQEAKEDQLREPERGYAIAGLSFTAQELFEEIRVHFPKFQYEVDLDPNMSKFMNLWPDTLSMTEAQEDLGYTPQVHLSRMVRSVLSAHAARNAEIRFLFAAIDEGTGTIEKHQLQRFIGQLMKEELSLDSVLDVQMDVRGLSAQLVDKVFGEMDFDGDAKVRIDEFEAWHRKHTMASLVSDFMSAEEFDDIAAMSNLRSSQQAYRHSASAHDL